ncbi:unnamed protein product [Paramecium sonneborni]|uniref:J domain-containing protein n=1 Tax=Paramecium sonneborni TaxID=65129 RepID=A0A8S1NH66_9CILI|nr:unnamed protein product [Paramecium sonneborni]
MLKKFQTFSFCTTLYQKLGVQPSDSIDTIKSAYIKLAKIYHPDVNLEQKEQEFKEITNAYNILKDPAKRKLYDLSIDFQQNSRSESNYGSNNESYQEKQYHNNPGWQYNGEQQNQWHNNNNQKNTYQQRTYQYTQQKSNSNQIYGLLALGGISIVFWSILSDDDDYSEKPRITKPAAPSIKISENPTSYAELKQIYDSIEQIDSKKMQRYYTHQAEEDQTELRRQNLIYQGQNLNDSPFIIEQRRKMMNEEMKQKKFKIQVEQYEKVIKGDSKILKRKDQNSEKKELKTKQGDLTLQGFAKQNKLDINKSSPVQQNQPINISIEHLEQGYM